MKNFTPKAIALFGLLACSSTFSQNVVPLKVRFHSTVKGDMTIIANNIVNRIDYNNKANDGYYNTTNQSVLNDDVMMGYIDIDKDESTFSSSSAELILDNTNHKKIVYAGLYWSATYKYNSGTKKGEYKYVVIDNKREQVNQIKFKTPNSDAYTSITGEMVFDGVNKREYKNDAPYVAYADITTYVNQNDASGIYTIANVRATEGMLSGGVAGGWTILFVYEDATMSAKSIVSYDGFSPISETPTDVNFSGFEAPSTGNVHAKIAFATLEGDTNLNNDQLFFWSKETDKLQALKTLTRKETNFFNSSITIEDQHFLNRFPDSKNTLGYDTALLTISNKNNTVIANNSKEAMLKFKTTGDRGYLFFTAFNIETESRSNVVASSDFSSSNVLKNMEEIKNKVSYINSTNNVLADKNQTLTSKDTAKKNYFIESTFTKTEDKDIKIKTENISNQNRGYFIIANVFADINNAKNFIKELQQNGVEANYFTNPLNDYKYVYISKTNKENEAIDLYLTGVNKTYNQEIWILSVNNNEQMLMKNSMLADTDD
jgi:hypothetical protein